MFDGGKTGLIGLPYGEKNYDNMFSRFHTIPACYGQKTYRRTDGQTDRRTDRIAISISRVSVLTRDKNETLLLSTASPNIDRFSKIFHHQTHDDICNKAVIKDSTTPETRRYTTL